MTAVKAGDRVRLTVEDTVAYAYLDGGFRTTTGRYFRPDGGDIMEVLPPVLHVDDVVTFEDLASAVEGTVVVDKDGDAWQFYGEEWLLRGYDDGVLAADYGPFVVVYAPKVKP